MNYAQTIALLDNYARVHGIKPGLERVTALLELLGNPHHVVPVIHVAGTNGKGSVVNMCQAALLECGYNVGAYFSPHFISYNERFILNGQQIKNGAFAKLFRTVYKAAQAVPGITEFELLTAMAFLYFAQSGVDIAIMETGLGGRYDATNVSKSILTIITPIAFDHQQILGKSLTKIAGEKAGIIKPGVPVIVAPQQEEALRVLQQRAEDLECDFTVVYHPIKFKLAALGDYQRYNASLVVEALRKLMNYKIYIPRSVMLNGIAKAKLRGRQELFATKPITILDVAHNPHGFSALFEVIKKEYPLREIVLLMGVLQTKDLKSILKTVKPYVTQLVAVNLLSSKVAYSAKQIAANAIELGINAVAAKKDVAAEYKQFAANPKYSNSVIVVAGSFYLLGEFYRSI